VLHGLDVVKFNGTFLLDFFFASIPSTSRRLKRTVYERKFVAIKTKFPSSIPTLKNPVKTPHGRTWRFQLHGGL
jgi:hypothetical protein